MNDVSKPTRLRLLVLEDEALVSMLIEDQVIELGFSVVGPAATVKQALALCATEPIDGALLDVNLGGGQRSDPVADYLETRNVPFLFVTGYGHAGLEPRFAEHAVLQKPFALPDLRRSLEALFLDPAVAGA
jgi:CheY-like chemotaxis protein